MHQVTDWNQRKREIGMRFKNEAFLPHESDAGAYAALLGRLDVTTRRDVSILISIVQDAIMMARRDELPTAPLDTFRDWLIRKQLE